MAEPLKRFFGESVVRAIARDLRRAHPLFDERHFVESASQGSIALSSRIGPGTSPTSCTAICSARSPLRPRSCCHHGPGALAQRSGLTRDALRFYERRGLLQAPQPTAGGFRVYPAETVARLRFIKQAQLVGLTLQEIAALVSHRNASGLRRCRQVWDLLRTKVADVDTKLSELEVFRTTLAQYLDLCERTISNSGTVKDVEAHGPVIDTLTREP